MSTALMMERIAEAPRAFEAKADKAKIAKAKIAKTKIAGVVFLLSVLTAALAEIFLRGGFKVAGGLIAVLGMIAGTLLCYDIVSPSTRRFLWLAGSFNLVGLAFEPLRLQPQGVNIAVVFDGFFCILIGCLVFRSTFLPRTLGVLMALGGLGWLAFLSPPLANYLSPYNLASGILGEGLVTLWLLLVGVTARPWTEQASTEGDWRN